MLSYLDAGSASMLAAAVAGGAAGLVVLARVYWHRILGVVSKKHREQARAAAAQLVGTSDQGR
jgi:hypothetical protein